MKKIGIFPIFLLLTTVAYAYTAQDYYNAGIQYYNQGQYEKAVQYFQATTQMDPNNWQAYQMLGTVYEKNGKSVEAMEAFRKSLQLNPNNPLLKKYVEESREKVKTPEKENLSPIDDKSVIIKVLQIAPGYALLDTAANGIKSDFPSGTSPTLYLHHNVFTNSLVGEVDFCFDKNDAVGVRYGPYNGTGFNFQGTYSSSGGATQVSNELYLNSGYEISVDYYRFLPDRLGRWYGSISADYVNANAGFNYYSNNGSVTVRQSDDNLIGDGVGFSLSFGRELGLTSFMALDAGIQFRYATVPKVTSSYSGGSGTQALATSSNGGLGLLDVKAIGQNGLQYAPIDLSGIYGMFSLNFYPF
ncbi:MAG TPA: tetratricopeptide repeat protein [bacterium]|nr:tetratricopeptide repeat protein [bacterium]